MTKIIPGRRYRADHENYPSFEGEAYEDRTSVRVGTTSVNFLEQANWTLTDIDPRPLPPEFEDSALYWCTISGGSKVLRTWNAEDGAFCRDGIPQAPPGHYASITKIDILPEGHVAVKMPEDVDTDHSWLFNNVIPCTRGDAYRIVRAYIEALEARDE